MSLDDKHTAALDALFAGVNRSDAPGLVVGVSQHGRTLYRRGFGLASLEHGTANTPATRLRIGSSSKHFACLAALLLAEDGKLDIHAPASVLLPELPKLDGMPTLRQFMDHTSGYRCYLDLATTAAGLALQPPGTALAAQVRQTGSNFAPGHGQLYCNGGYHLLSIAIERAAGLPFEQVLKTRLFDPLGLHDTESVPTDMLMLPRMATQHVSAPGGGWRRGIFPSEEVRGEGGIVSTVDDMLAWLAHLRGADKRFGNAATWRELTTVTTLASGLVSNYACGLWRHAWRGIELVYHSGNVNGGACQMLTVPAHGLDIVILTNGALVAPVEMARRIVELLLSPHLKGPAPKMTGARRFQHLAGTRYLGESGLVLGFDTVGAQLGISMQLSPPAPILRDEGATLRVAFEDVAMGPFVLRVADLKARADGSAPKTLDIAESGRTERYTRLPARAPSLKKAGAALVGRYRSVDLDAVATIAFDGDALTLAFRGPYGSRHHVLDAVAPTVFGVTARDEWSPGRFAIVVERHGAAVTGFVLNTARTRRLRFERLSDDDRS